MNDGGALARSLGLTEQALKSIVDAQRPALEIVTPEQRASDIAREIERAEARLRELLAE